MARQTVRAPRVNEVVNYFRATTRKPVPAKVTGGIVGQIVNLKLADGSTQLAVAQRTALLRTGVWDYQGA